MRWLLAFVFSVVCTSLASAETPRPPYTGTWYVGSGLYDSYFLNLDDVQHRAANKHSATPIVVLNRKYDIQKSPMLFDCTNRAILRTGSSTYNGKGRLTSMTPPPETPAWEAPEDSFDKTALDLVCNVPDSVGVSYAKRIADGVTIGQYTKYALFRDYNMNDCSELKIALEVSGAPKTSTEGFLQTCTPAFIEKFKATRKQLGMR